MAKRQMAQSPKHSYKITAEDLSSRTGKQKEKLHIYQKRLLESDSAKLLAVRKATQDNRGKKTPGIDGIKFLEPEERLKLAKGIRIDGKNLTYSKSVYP